MFERYDPAAYNVGDQIFIQIPAGWNEYTAKRYEVIKRTPSGQIVAAAGADVIRISARGDIVGEGSYGRRSVCNPDKAAELRAAAKVRAAWALVRDAADAVERVSRQRDAAELPAKLNALRDAIATLYDRSDDHAR